MSAVPGRGGPRADGGYDLVENWSDPYGALPGKSLKYRADQARDEHGRWTFDSWGDIRAGAEVRVTVDNLSGNKFEVEAIFDPSKSQLARWAGEDVHELRALHWQDRSIYWDASDAYHVEMMQALHDAGTGLPDATDFTETDLTTSGVRFTQGYTRDILANWGGKSVLGVLARLANLFKYSPDQARDDHGRWTDEGGGAAGTLTQLLAEHGGFTYQPVSHDAPKEGYALSILPGHEQVIEGEVKAEDIQRYMDAHAQLFAENPQAHFGAWRDTASGKVYLDVSVVEPDRQTAIDLGKAHGQLAIYNLGTGETVRIADEARTHAFPAELDRAADRRRHQQGARAGPDDKALTALAQFANEFTTDPATGGVLFVRGMNMPTPKPGEETQAEWMKRCVPTVLDDGSAANNDQAVAMCIHMWDRAGGKTPATRHGNSNFANRVLDQLEALRVLCENAKADK